MGQHRNVFSGASKAFSSQARGIAASQRRGLRAPAVIQSTVGSQGPASSAVMAHGIGRTQRAASSSGGFNLRKVWGPALIQGMAARRAPTAVDLECLALRQLGCVHNSPGYSRQRPARLLRAAGSSGGGASQGRIASEVRTPNGSIKWGCYLSRRSTLEDAVDECIAQIRRAMQPGGGGNGRGSGEKGLVPEPQPELAIVFVSAAFGPDFDRLVPLLRERLPSLKHVFGCSAFGVLGGGRSGTTEADGEPALSLTLGSLPGVDIRVFHTLRSSVPEEDAAVERWANFVGVPADTTRHVSFLMFSDPRFTQLYNILEGLDYSFPRAAKLGGMLSVGVRSRQRAMFAWSAEQDVRTRVKPRAAAAAASAAAAAASTDAATEIAAAGRGSGAAAAETGEGGGGSWLQRSLNLLSKLTGQTGGGRRQGGGGGGLITAFGGGGSRSGAAADDDLDTVISNGTYLYGAVCLVLHGDVKLDAIVSQGYRAPSPTIWRVEATTAGMSTGAYAPAGHILTISDAREAPPTPLPPSPLTPTNGGVGDGEGGTAGSAMLNPPGAAGGRPSLPSSASASSASAAPSTTSGSSGISSSNSSSSSFGSRLGARRGGVRGSGGRPSSFLGGGAAAASRRGGGGGRGGGAASTDDSDNDDDDDDGDSDDDDEMDEDDLASMYDAMGVSGTPSLAAIIDVVEALGSESAVWEEVMETCAVAVAADTTKPLEELGPADWEIMELKGVDQKFGTIIVDGEVRRGYRIKIMVRDPPGLSEDLRAQLLAYKREDLRRVLSGSSLPPSFGALVFTDVERTPTSSGSDVTESELINAYLPLPTGGMFGGAQIAPLPGGTELVEYSSVIGVLRAMAALPPEPLRSHDDVETEGAGKEGSGQGGSGGNVAGKGGMDSDDGGGGGSSRRRVGDGGKGGGGKGSGRGGGGGSRRFGGSGGGSTRIYRGRDA